jgi:hypothetical protein
MVTIVAVSINGSVARVQCDGLSRDSVLSKNIVLAGCKELDTEGRDGVAVDTKIWSLPESMILSYAIGNLPVVQAPEPVVEVVDQPVVMSPEEIEAHQARRKRIDREARRRRDAERRARAKLAAAAPKPELKVEPVEKPAKRKKKPAAP